MTKKRAFPKEAPTSPGGRRSAPVAKGKAPADDETVRRAEAPTLPPPPLPNASSPPARDAVTSGVRPRRGASIPAAAVDEVTADLSRDPRREREEESPRPPRTRPKK